MHSEIARRGRAARALLAGALAAVAVLAGVAGPSPAQAQDNRMAIGAAELSSARHIQLGLGKSLVIDLPRDAKDVLVSDPSIADAVMRTARRAYLIGVEVGQTNVFFFDGAGRQIAVLEVQVERDMALLSQSLRQLLPGSNIRVQSVNDNIVLTGSVRTPADAVNAAGIAGRFVGDAERVMNMIDAEGSEQVHLKVTVAEVRRNTLKQFGVNLQGLINGGTQFAVLTDNPFALGGAISDTFARGTFGRPGNDTLDATVRAMEQNGVLRVLAEPTLSAISGESAEFLAGGEFPVITGVDQNTGAPIIEFKEFGVSLAFTPIVQSEGRIAIKVKTEVSEISNEASISLGNNITVPGLNTRKADTTVELPSGGSLVLAGLIKQDTKHSINGIPGLKNIPILGALFRSRDYINSDTEMVVIATPYLVRPVARQELARPDDGFAPATDPGAVFLGRLNRVYGQRGEAPRGGYHGHAGFIID